VISGRRNLGCSGQARAKQYGKDAFALVYREGKYREGKLRQGITGKDAHFVHSSCHAANSDSLI
jgi:hypothetical protein